MKSHRPCKSATASQLIGACLGLALAAGTATAARAQGQLAAGTVTGSGSGPFSYSLTFSDASSATSPIGSVWYAWVPGAFYLPGTPATASAPTGWTASIDGNSVQYVATSAIYDITPGHSLAGFGYQASFSPSQLAATPNSGLSVAYSGGLFSDGGNTFSVQIVPEPSAVALLLPIAILFWLLSRHRRSSHFPVAHFSINSLTLNRPV